MQAAFDCVVPYVTKSSDGVALAASQLIQAKVADIYTALESTRTYIYSAAMMCERKQGTK